MVFSVEIMISGVLGVRVSVRGMEYWWGERGDYVADVVLSLSLFFVNNRD